MKKIIFFLLVLFGTEQVLGVSEPMFPYGSYPKEKMKGLLLSGSEKCNQLANLFLYKTGESDINSLFEKVTIKYVSLKAGEWRNSCWDSGKKEIISFLGKDYEGLAGVYQNYGEEIMLWKYNCGNGINSFSEAELNILRDEDLPYIPPEKPQPGEGGKDYYVDTLVKEVYYHENGSTVNNYYYGDGENYNSCNSCYQFYPYYSWLSWGFYWYPSSYIYYERHPDVYVHNYNYNYNYKYNIHPLPPPDPGGPITPPGHDDGSRRTQPGHGDDNYYGHRNGNSSDGVNGVGPSRRVNNDVYSKRQSLSSSSNDQIRKTYSKTERYSSSTGQKVAQQFKTPPSSRTLKTYNPKESNRGTYSVPSKEVRNSNYSTPSRSLAPSGSRSSYSGGSRYISSSQGSRGGLHGASGGSRGGR